MSPKEFALAPDYNDVAARIREFRAKYPDGALRPADITQPYRVETIGGQTFIVYVAAAYRGPDDALPGIGSAWCSFPGRTPYTKFSELQNAETSAWGRAIIAALAADAKRIASDHEIEVARSDNEAPDPVVDGRASRADKARIAMQLARIEDLEARAGAVESLREIYGPSESLLAVDLEDAVEFAQHIADHWVAEQEKPFAPKNEDGSDAPSLLEPGVGEGEASSPGSYKPQDNSSLAGNVTNIRADADVI